MNIKNFHKLQDKTIVVFGKEFRLDLIQFPDTDDIDIWAFESKSLTTPSTDYNAFRLQVNFNHSNQLLITARVCYRGKGDEAPNGWYDRETSVYGRHLRTIDTFCNWISEYMEFVGEDWFKNK